MGNKSRGINDLARAVSDGEVIDWDRILQDSSPGERAIVRQLEVVSGIASFFDARQRALPVQAPRRWGDLEVLEKISEGAFSEVFRARDRRLDRDVALKLLDASRGPRPEVASPVIAEARRLAKVRHPNVATVFGADARDGRIGIWMELVRGQTLEEILQQRGPFGAKEASLVGVDLCRALAAVHDARLLHRDVKTQNVLREEGGRIVLMDFGVGRDRAAESGEPFGGTPLYMAPEVLGRKEHGETSDIYSLGVLLFRLVSGRFPVEASSIEDLIEAHERGRRVFLRDLRPDVGESFQGAVERALDRSPSRRWESAGAMEQALLRAVEDLDGPAATGGKGVLSRRRLLAAVGGLAVLLLAGYVLVRGIPAGSPSYEIRAALHRLNAGGAEELSPGDLVDLGDRIFLEIESSRDIHLYVVSEDDRGDAFLLFPLPEYDQQNPLSGGILHRIPGPIRGADSFWQITSRGGREHFLLVASPDRLQDFEAELLRVPQPRVGGRDSPAPLPEGAVRTLRGVGAVVEGRPTSSATAGSRLSALVSRLQQGAETVRGVWVRKIDLANPGS